MKVSVIGLGIMGLPMAKNLNKAGYLFKVYNRTKEKTKYFESTTVSVANSPKEAAEGADVIITMVSNSPDVKEVVLGKQGAIHGMSSNAVLVDMSSINPELTKEIGKEIESKGSVMLDAPVSGGEKGAIQGTLAIMAGGDKEVLKKVYPILNTLGSSIVHVGPLGAGGYAKLANQIIVGLELQAMAEAFNLAKKADLEIESLFQAIRKGLAGSNVLEQKIGNLLEESFQPGFKIKLHLKDINNALQAAESQNIELPLTKMTRNFMEEMVAEGYGDLDHSALYEHLSRRNN